MLGTARPAVRGPRRAALTVFAGVLVLLAHARVTVAPGCAIPAPALVLAAGVALCAAAAWLAIMLARGFRSSPAWRPARTAGQGGGAR